ncbi:MAG: dihydropteroate synthase [Planktomarina sp.]
MPLRPILAARSDLGADAVQLGGGTRWFTHVEEITRKGRRILSVQDVEPERVLPLTAPRVPMANVRMDQPQIMGILNVTPDSFSDGGLYNAADVAVARAQQMAQEGASILDIGGESTRPGADFVPADTEITRTAPVIEALNRAGMPPISIDTRKAPVAQAAVAAGAAWVNDVSAGTYDAGIAEVAARHGAPLCLMHAQGDPKTMQNAPCYDDVVLDVYDFLEGRIAWAETMGVARSQIIVDPGIGFGKTLDHNLALLRDIAVFHALGCPILLGASRKRFIGEISGADAATDRMAGSVAVALAAVAQGVQIVRVHDVAQTDQALRLWQAVTPA